MTDYRLAAERALKEITAALDTLAATITAALDNLAAVGAPAPTIAEKLREEASWAEEIGAPVHGSKFRALADRAEQIEQERNTLEQQRDYWCDSERQAAKDRDHLAAEIDKANTDILHLTAERDEAKKERDHFFREVENVRNWKEQLLNERDEAHAEVNRLTAEQDTEAPHNHDWLAGMKDATRYAVNATHPDHADVKPGEAWIVECRGERRTAVKDRDDDEPWNTVSADGRFFFEENEDITLLHRLVPAPRVITNPDELERLAEGSIVRDRAGHAWERCPDEDWYSTEELDDGFSSRRLADYAGPVTVLWEPGA